MPRRRPTHPRFDASDGLHGAPLAGRLDLHGMSADQAESAVRSFIDNWRRREPGAVVLIITGKGKGFAALRRPSPPASSRLLSIACL